MLRSDREAGSTRRLDLPALLALTWALVFGLAYSEMMARARAPRWSAAVRRAVGFIVPPSGSIAK